MARAVYEPTVSVYEGVKTLRALDRCVNNMKPRTVKLRFLYQRDRVECTI
jgi:hypothetical protein